jgi:hypothetical protein
VSLPSRVVAISFIEVHDPQRLAPIEEVEAGFTVPNSSLGLLTPCVPSAARAADADLEGRVEEIGDPVRDVENGE